MAGHCIYHSGSTAYQLDGIRPLERHSIQSRSRILALGQHPHAGRGPDGSERCTVDNLPDGQYTKDILEDQR